MYILYKECNCFIQGTAEAICFRELFSKFNIFYNKNLIGNNINYKNPFKSVFEIRVRINKFAPTGKFNFQMQELLRYENIYTVSYYKFVFL